MNNESDSKEAVLRVASNSPAKALAAAISNAVYDGKQVTLRCIGASSVNQAVKAIAIGQTYVGGRGLVLACRPGFITVTTKTGDTSVILLRVFTM